MNAEKAGISGSKIAPLRSKKFISLHFLGFLFVIIVSSFTNMNVYAAMPNCPDLTQSQCNSSSSVCMWSDGQCKFNPTSDGLCTEGGQIRICPAGYWCNNAYAKCDLNACSPNCKCPAGSSAEDCSDDPIQCEPDEYDAGGECESCEKYKYGAGDYCEFCSVRTICDLGSGQEFGSATWEEMFEEQECTPWIMDPSFDREQILTENPCSVHGYGAMGRYYGKSRCASGYHGDGRVCTQCPGIMGGTVSSPYGKEWEFIAYNDMSEADDSDWDWGPSWGNETQITDCYIPAGTVAQDSSGTFIFTQNCNYTN